nr:hypothetical protein [Cupriavidus necator]
MHEDSLLVGVNFDSDQLASKLSRLSSQIPW